MLKNINEKISNKIIESTSREEIKDFIRDILIFEFEHFEEARPRYMEKYEGLINKYVKLEVDEE